MSLPLIALTGFAWLALLLGYDALAARLPATRSRSRRCSRTDRGSSGRSAWASPAASLACGRLPRGAAAIAVMTIAFSTLIAAQLVLTGHDTLAESRSSAPLLARIVAKEGPLRADVPFYTVACTTRRCRIISVAP